MAFVTAVRGRLVLDFSWQSIRCREYLDLPDDRDGRARARSIKKQIEGELAAKTFDYLKRFPQGAKRALFAPPEPVSRPAPAVATFEVLARDWLANRKAWFTPGTVYDRGRIIDGKLIPFFRASDGPEASSRLVSTITVDDVERLINAVKEHAGTRGQRLSNRRANMILDVLRLILDRAVSRGWLPGNPARAVRKLREERAEIDPFSFAEVKTLLAKGFPDREDRRFSTVALFAGLRPSEQIAAQWDAVDWAATPPRLGILGAITTRGGRGQTKTPGSKRYVELLPIVQQALREQRSASQLRGPLIFPSHTGTARDITNLRERVWKPALRRAQLRYRTMYQTRHTFASLALQSGEQLGWVSKQLGHTNDEMVIRHYAKFIPNLTRQDGSALARVMGEQGVEWGRPRAESRAKCQKNVRKSKGATGPRPVTPHEIGAADRIRTGDVQLGKLAFCH